MLNLAYVQTTTLQQNLKTTNNMAAIREICLLDDIRYLRDLLRINVMSHQIRELIKDILDDAERHKMKVTLKQFNVLRTHLSVKIKAKRC